MTERFRLLDESRHRRSAWRPPGFWRRAPDQRILSLGADPRPSPARGICA
jgi:hypothetical protein